ncbi:hypothetical protein GCM10010123_24650 [Pilimelia anulata]|uniref:Nicotinate ribosyltransferase n=1 Tax=Pilimelia anulata TaxID=53371 RepID=A0A8J3B6W5_9ACTN|nr:hypothetical protein [Pilimelia anulata]GGJ93849.1 hypothetical protein GCM10010123_24650 [Pilimelia anulata]
MSHQLWSWLLTAVGVTGLWLAGQGLWIGWAVGLASQLLWLAYSITTAQWGFLASCFVYGTVHACNLCRNLRQRAADTGADNTGEAAR